MNHPTDDTLLKLVLELLDDNENAALREHLDRCADCRARYERMRANTDMLGSISPDVEAPSLPSRTHVVRFGSDQQAAGERRAVPSRYNIAA